MSNMESLLFYIIMFGITTIFIYLSECVKGKIPKKLFEIIGIVIPVLIASLRWNVGSDFYVYVNMYNSYKEIGIASNIEMSFLIISKIANVLGNVQYMFAIYSVFTVFFVYKTLKYNSEKYSLSLTFFLYLFLYFSSSLNIIRQALAIAIIFYSYRHLIEKNIIKFITYVLIASLVHITALIFIPIYFIVPKEDNERKKIKFIQLIAIAIMVLIILNFNTVMKYLTSMDTLEKYSTYSSYTSEVSGKNKMLIVRILLLTVFLIFRKKIVNYESKNSIYLVLYIIGVILEFTGYNSPFVKRIASYFTISELYLISSLPKIFNKKDTKMTVVLVIICYAIAIFFISFYVLKQANIIPYQSIFRNFN